MTSGNQPLFVEPEPELLQSIRIGVPSIDKEHRDLVMQIEMLNRNPNSLPDSAVFLEILSQLGLQIRLHFDNEESVLRGCGMPHEEVADHIQAHNKILDQYVRLNFDIMEGKAVTRSEAFTLVNGWIIGHLMKYDLRIRTYFPVSTLPRSDAVSIPSNAVE